MGDVTEETKSSECEIPEDVWFQITFTLDPKSFRQLWAYAESNNSSVSSVARDRILNFLKVLESPSHDKKLFPKKSVGNES